MWQLSWNGPHQPPEELSGITSGCGGLGMGEPPQQGPPSAPGDLHGPSVSSEAWGQRGVTQQPGRGATSPKRSHPPGVALSCGWPPQSQPRVPIGVPTAGLAVSPLYCDSSKIWLSPTKPMSPPLSPGGLGTNQDPPPAPHQSSSGVPVGVGDPCPAQPGPLGAVPASLSQQRKTSPDGSGGRVVTATLPQGLHQNPRVPPQKHAQGPRSPAHSGEWDPGVGTPQPRCPRAAPGGRGDSRSWVLWG